ncbi:unnamed protein product [Cercopithifilaria johnstoni]|uniref:Uncharacterized protein n=1 Tax=Cercopithifilaria johnstoni TaxID=2874296 RepID=A0A8J2MBK1_9BILA|nr:unnamed protein product [Cercopithifilaria johnstoni]
MKKVLIILSLMILLVTPLYGYEDEMDEENDGSDEDMSDEEEDIDEEGHEIDENGGGGEEGYITKAEFVETDGKKKHCDSHEACYDQREPQSWCIMKDGQSWTDKGCFCEEKMHSCIIERKNGQKLEYAYCAPQANWQCSYD